MPDHLMQFKHTPIEIEPTRPDADGMRWRQYAPGTATANCTCGLTINGPRSAVAPLAHAHRDS